MSTAYFIVLDSDNPGFDTFVDGKVLTKRLDSINQIAKTPGLAQFEDYVRVFSEAHSRGQKWHLELDF